MRKLILFILMLGTINLNAQELEVFETDKGKVGYMSAAGEVVIKGIYDYGEPFIASGLAVVGKGKKYGLIDTGGNVVLPIQYDEVDIVSLGTPARIRKDKNYGLVDPQTGKIVLEPEFAYISPFNCHGLALVKHDNKNTKSAYYNSEGTKWSSFYGIIDKDFKWRIEPSKYELIIELPRISGVRASNLEDTLTTDCHILGVSKNKFSNLDVVDGYGNVLGKGYELFSDPVNGMMRWWRGKNSSWSKDSISYGYININNGKEIECGKLGPKGFSYESIRKSIRNIGEARENLRKGKRQDKHMFWLNGFTTHGDFYGSIAPICKIDGSDTTWCFIDRQGDEMHSGYKNVEISMGKKNDHVYYVCDLIDRYRIFTSNNEELFSNKVIQKFDLPDPNYGDNQDFALCVAGKWGVFSRNGTTFIAPQQYDWLSSSQYGIYMAMKNGKCGYLNRQGKVIVPLIYKNIYKPLKYDQPAVWVRIDTDDLVCEEVYSNYNIKEKKLSSNKYYAKSFHSYTDGTSWGVPYIGKSYTNGMTEGYFLDEYDKRLIAVPFPVEYVGIATQKVASNGGKPLSNNKSRSFVLMMKRYSKTYSIDEVIPDEEWDY